MEDICAICSEEIISIKSNFCITSCGHKFHLKCMGSLIASSGNSSSCPECRARELTGKDDEGKSNVEDLTEKFCRLMDVPAINLESKIQRYALIDRAISRQIAEQPQSNGSVFYLVLSDIGNIVKIFKLTVENLTVLSSRYTQSVIFNSNLMRVFDQLSMLPRHYEQFFPELISSKLECDSVIYARILDRILCTDETNTNILYRHVISNGNQHTNGSTILQFVRSFVYKEETVSTALNLGYRGCTWVFTSGSNKNSYCFKLASNSVTCENPLNYRCAVCASRRTESLCFTKLRMVNGIIEII